jgi:hypothetical protein
MDSDPATASQKLQINLEAIQDWLGKWRIKAIFIFLFVGYCLLTSSTRQIHNTEEHIKADNKCGK